MSSFLLCCVSQLARYQFVFNILYIFYCTRKDNYQLKNTRIFIVQYYHDIDILAHTTSVNQTLSHVGSIGNNPFEKFWKRKNKWFPCFLNPGRGVLDTRCRKNRHHILLINFMPMAFTFVLHMNEPITLEIFKQYRLHQWSQSLFLIIIPQFHYKLAIFLDKITFQYIYVYILLKT